MFIPFPLDFVMPYTIVVIKSITGFGEWSYLHSYQPERMFSCVTTEGNYIVIDANRKKDAVQKRFAVSEGVSCLFCSR